MKARLGLLALSLAAAGVWLAWATTSDWDSIQVRRYPPILDFLDYYHPNAQYAATRLAAGDVPLWDPRHGFGGPFLATLQPGVLYPPNWLHLALPPARAFTALSALHIALAFLAVGLLARRAGAGLAGAGAAGAIYAFSQELFLDAWTPPMLHAACWIPAVWWCVDRCCTRPGPAAAALFGAAFALQILAGWPYFVVLTFYSSLLYGGALLLRETLRARHPPWAAIGSLTAGGAVAAALAAPQLLPALELLPLSTRSLGALDRLQLLGGALHSYDLGHVVKTLTARPVELAAGGLALFAFRLGGIRAASLLLLGALAFGVSLPADLPLFDWARSLPVLGGFRFPFRYRVISLVCTAVLCGIGVTGLTRLAGRVAVRRALGLAALLLVAAAQARPVDPALAIPRVDRERTADDTRWLPADPAALPPERVYWVRNSRKLRPAERVHAVNDLEPMTLRETAEIATYFSLGRALTYYPSQHGVVERGQAYSGGLKLPDDGERARLLDAMSVRYVLPKGPGGGWLSERFEALERGPFRQRAYRNGTALPRAYRVPGAERAPGDSEALLARLADPDFDLRRSVLLDTLPEGAGDGADDPGAGARVESYEPEAVRIRTRGSVPGFLVLTDALYPGWQVSIDDVPAPLLRANHAFRAVAVPAGESLVEFRYAPASWRHGRLGAALGALALLGLVVASRRSGRPGKT